MSGELARCELIGRQFTAFVYVLTGRGTTGAEGRPVDAGRLVVFGPGDHLVLRATDRASEQFDVLLLGGLPIREPVVHHGGFVMNTRREVVQACRADVPFVPAWLGSSAATISVWGSAAVLSAAGRPELVILRSWGGVAAGALVQPRVAPPVGACPSGRRFLRRDSSAERSIAARYRLV